MPSASFSGLQRGRQLRLRESYDATLLSPCMGVFCFIFLFLLNFSVLPV